MSDLHLVYVPSSDTQELLCSHAACQKKDEPVKVWQGVSVDVDKVRSAVQEHQMSHIQQSFEGLWKSLKDFGEAMGAPPDDTKEEGR
jgi:hypothetical protein